jgi:K+-sensing histidine kinase KdpD
MYTSKPVTFGVMAAMAVAAGVMVNQHNQLVAQAEQLAADSYQIMVQQDQIRSQTERLQVRAETSGTLVSQSELPAVVVFASRLSAQAR